MMGFENPSRSIFHKPIKHKKKCHFITAIKH